MTKVVSLCVLAAIFLAFAVPAVAQREVPLKMTISGRGGFPLGAEIDGQSISLGICGGNSNFGKYECTTTFYAVTQYAGYDTGLCPDAHQIDVVSGSGNHIVRFENGDVLIMLLDLTKPNYTCQNAASGGDFVATGVEYRSWRITGGSGKFDGATGFAQWAITGAGIPLGSEIMSVAYPSPIWGSLTLQNGKHHGRD